MTSTEDAGFVDCGFFQPKRGEGKKWQKVQVSQSRWIFGASNGSSNQTKRHLLGSSMDDLPTFDAEKDTMAASRTATLSLGYVSARFNQV